MAKTTPETRALKSVSEAFPIGSLVTVRGAYQMGEREGQGEIVPDAWTGRTMRVFGVCRDDLLLGHPNDDTDEVGIHFGRCTPVSEGK